VIDINRIQHAQMEYLRFFVLLAAARLHVAQPMDRVQSSYWSTNRSIYRCQPISSRDSSTTTTTYQ